MTAAGRLYLNENKKRLKLPLVSKAAAFSNPSLDMDIHAADMYALGIGNGTSSSRIGVDYNTHQLLFSKYSQVEIQDFIQLRFGATDAPAPSQGSFAASLGLRLPLVGAFKFHGSS